MRIGITTMVTVVVVVLGWVGTEVFGAPQASGIGVAAIAATVTIGLGAVWVSRAPTPTVGEQAHQSGPEIEISSDPPSVCESDRGKTVEAKLSLASNSAFSSREVLRGHTGAVTQVAFSSDGALLASASWDKAARLWNVATGSLVQVFEGHEAYLSGVAFGPDGSVLATASADTTARLWDIETGSLIQLFKGHRAHLSGVAFSPDGSVLATASADMTARLWDVNSGSLLHVLNGHEDSVSSVVFSPNGAMLATGSQDGTARIWDARTGAPVHILRGHSNFVLDVAFSPDGYRVGTASRDGTARLWEVTRGTLVSYIRASASPVYGLAFSSEDDLLVTAERDGGVRLWNSERADLVQTLIGHDGTVEAVTFSPDGLTIATGGADRTIRLWTPENRLPGRLRFLSLVGLDPPLPEQISARWADGGRTPRAVLGWQAGGPFIVDMSAGPHLLVGGTTGSGKSELLTTLVASLAAANHPDAMNFILIDYKGGTAFSGLHELPHTVGVVADLDDLSTARMLLGLRAEVRRRAEMLARVGAEDIETYWSSMSLSTSAEPLPRLVIVADEFAVISEYYPAFLKSMIDIQNDSRSLGIHFILGSQRPAGAVSKSLQDSMHSRIALRVKDDSDSAVIIGSGDAARISPRNPGRAISRQPLDAAPVVFQAAYVRGIWQGEGEGAKDHGIDPGSLERQCKRTDLDVLVSAIESAAKNDGYPQRRQVLGRPLPAAITLKEVNKNFRQNQRQRSAWQIVFGTTERPGESEQMPAVWDLTRNGSLLIIGGRKSGRTSLLKTLAGGVCMQLTAAEARLYVVDSGGELAALGQLPQCEAVISASEPERLSRLLDQLFLEYERRRQGKSRLGQHASTDNNLKQSKSDNPPALILLIDNYYAAESKLAVFSESAVRRLRLLIKDGGESGIKIVASGDAKKAFGSAAGIFSEKIVLRLDDPVEYAMMGIHTEFHHIHLPPGRGFRLPGVDLLQFATLAVPSTLQSEEIILAEIARRFGEPPSALIRV